LTWIKRPQRTASYKEPAERIQGQFKWKMGHVGRTDTHPPPRRFLLGGFSGRFGGYGYGFGHGGMGVIGLILIVLLYCFSWVDFDLIW